MRRCIYADSLLTKIKAYRPYQYLGEDALSYAIKMVELEPSADVVEVVRCKDCIYKEECGREVLVNEYDNDKAVDITGFLFYCSYGERAEE